MIVYRAGSSTIVRRGEFEPLPGLRGRFRAIPYPGFARQGADLWARTYRAGRTDQETSPGGRRPEQWRDALSPMRAGPLLIGPAPSADAIYGVVPAIVAASRDAGIGIVLLDAAEGHLPVAPGEDVVIVHLWRAGEESTLGLRCAATVGIGSTGIAIPVIPGCTDISSRLTALLSDVRRCGATFVATFLLDLAGLDRTALLDDVEAMGIGSGELFDRLFHGRFEAELAASRQRIEEASVAAGLEVCIPLPRGVGEHFSNLAARQALEREAAESADPSASELRRAARRIEDYRGDLAALFREGNGRLVVEPGSRAWRLVEAALAESRPR